MLRLACLVAACAAHPEYVADLPVRRAGAGCAPRAGSGGSVEAKIPVEAKILALLLTPHLARRTAAPSRLTMSS